MQIIKDLQDQIERAWEPILKPPRTPLSNDILGYKYVNVGEEAVFKRHDDTFTSFDDLKLHYTCYFKINERLKSLVIFQKSSIYNSIRRSTFKDIRNDFQIKTLKGKL